MHNDSLQQIRYKLQSRFRSVKGSNYQNFVLHLVHLLKFLDSTSITRSVVDLLSKKYGDVIAKNDENLNNESALLSGKDTEEHAALALGILRRWGSFESSAKWVGESLFVSRAAEHDARLSQVISDYVHPLYQHIDESLDDNRAVLAHLFRYKHRTEWYRREELYRKYSEETGKGERHLADDLYLYLHDQGIDFIVEPHTVSGIPDLLVYANEFNRIVADAKVFDPDRGKNLSYLAKGFHQVYTYLNDYNEPFGYLVIFNLSGKDLTLDVSGVDTQIPYATHNGKTIFLHVIDIFPYEASASKRGHLETRTLRETDLVRAIEESEEAGSNPISSGAES